MPKLKQKYNAYKTALSFYNKRMVAVKAEFSQVMSDSLKDNDLEKFKAVADTLCELLIDRHSWVVTIPNNILILHNMEPNYEYKKD